MAHGSLEAGIRSGTQIGKIRNSKLAVTRVKERPGFPIRNKFELPEMEQ